MTRAKLMNAKGMAIAGLLLGLVACSGGGATADLDRGKRAMAEQDFSAAVLHLKNSLQADSQNAESRLLLAQALRRLGDMRGALVEVEKLVTSGIDPDAVLPLHAELLNAVNQPKRALDAYADTELKSAPAQARLLLALSEGEEALRHPAEAQRRLDQALKAQPDFLPALLVQARRMAIRGEVEQAMAQAARLTERADANADAWRLKAQLELALRNNKEAARAAYAKAIALESDDLRSHLGLVAIAMSERNLDLARSELAKVPKRLADAVPVRYMKAAIDLDSGQVDSAFEQAQQLLKQLPDETQVLLLAGQIEYLRGNFVRAEAHLAKAFAQAGDQQRPRLLLAQTYLQLQDPQRALQTVQPLMSGKAQDPKPFGVAGEAYRQLGDMEKAEQAFRRAAELRPDSVTSRVSLAMSDLRAGREGAGLNALTEIAQSSDQVIADVALVSAYVARKDWQAATQAIDAIERKSPKGGVAPSLRGQMALVRGQPEEARAAFEEALKRDPRHLPAAAQLARLDIGAGKPDAAKARLAAVVKAEPANAQAWLMWLQLRMELGEAPDALRSDVDALLRQHPRLVDAHVLSANLWLSGGDLEAAIRAAQAGAAALPREPQPLRQLVVLQLRKGDSSQAMQALERLAAVLPRAPEVPLQMAEIQRRDRQLQAALSSVRRALSLRANDADALSLQVNLLVEMGDLDAARRSVKEIERIENLSALGSLLLGDVELNARRLDAAADAYRRALVGKRVPVGAAAKLHRTLRAAGREVDAKSFATQWERQHPDDLVFLTYLGDLALSQQDHAQAIGRYQRVLERNPQLSMVHNNLAWAHLGSGDAVKGLAAANEAVRRVPTAAAFQDTRAAMLSALGRHEEALQVQRLAMALEPSDPGLRVDLGKRLKAAGKAREARAEWQAVEKLGASYAGQSELKRLLAEP